MVNVTLGNNRPEVVINATVTLGNNCPRVVDNATVILGFPVSNN